MAEEQEERKRPDVAKEYSDGSITVRWSPQYCIHVANCLTMQPGVFDSMRRPWIMLDEAGADDIAEAVTTCPTGALTFERHDGGDQEPEPDEMTVIRRPNGPLFLRGKIRVVNAQGDVLAEDCASKTGGVSAWPPKRAEPFRGQPPSHSLLVLVGDDGCPERHRRHDQHVHQSNEDQEGAQGQDQVRDFEAHDRDTEARPQEG